MKARRAVVATMALAAAGLAAALDAVLVEPQMLLSVTRVDLPAGHGGRLSGRLRETRVVHLTDLHVRGLGARERRLMRRLQEIEPDLILMTGDYAEGPDGPAALAGLLGAVRPALGTWAALGNNDHYRGQRQSVLEALAKAGAVVLRNRHVVLEAPGGPVAIAAVDDPHYDWDDSEAALAGLAEDVPVVLLAHSADLLLPGRGYGLLVNAADERGAWKRGWFWQDGAHMRPDLGEVTFPSTGRRRLRVQRREDGVGVSEIRLVPATGPARRRGFRGMPEPEPVEGQIVVRMESIADEDIHGGWSRLETEKGMALVDGPDRGITQSFPKSDPDSYFEAEFDAERDVRYHVWVHLRSGNTRGTSDSLFVQFTDSLDAFGQPNYRIGAEKPPVDRRRVDMMLAGHTHGGQVRLPLVGALEPNVRRTPWPMGLYDVDGMALNVSRGVGWSALPVRFFCPPEVVVMERPVTVAAQGGKRGHAGSL